MSQICPELRTVGVVARELGRTVAEVQAALLRCPHVKPIARAGIYRLFDGNAVAQLRHHLNARDARRAAREADHA